MATARFSRRWGTALLLGVLVAGSSCTASDDDDPAPAAVGCRPGDARALRALTDDKAALPSDNWLPVVSTRGGYRRTLELLDTVSRGLSGADLLAISGTIGAEREAAISSSIADVPEDDRSGRVLLLGAEGDDEAAALSYYRFALQRMGLAVKLKRVDLETGLSAASRNGRTAVITTLGPLGAAVNAELPEGGDASAQVQAVATAALDRRGLALGATSAASDAPEVLVTDALATAKSLTTVSELVAACPDATLAVVGDDQPAARRLSEVYGLIVGPAVGDAASAFTTDGDSLAVLTRGD